MKKTEHRRIDAFELWRWRRFLRVPWIARRSNQSVLKEINTEYSLEDLMLKLKLQKYSGYLMWRVNSLEEIMMLGKIEGRSRSGWQRMRWLDGIIDSMDWVWANSGRWWRKGRPGVLQFMGLQSWARLNDWTTATIHANLVTGIIHLVLLPIGLVLFYLHFIRKILQQGSG